jgi:hypothetical protein
MQTSRNRSSFSGQMTRVSSGGVAVGLLLLVTSSWVSCSPGEPDCDKVMCGAGGNAGGTGGDTGGTGGGGGTPGGGIAAECGKIGVKSAAEFETKFIAVKCGGDSACHQAVFPPRGLNMPAKIKGALVGVKAQTLCKEDYYINTSDPAKSFLLMKLTADNDMVDCPTPDAKGGGFRMPLKKGTIDKPDTRLTDDEIACLTWYVESFKM